MKVKVFNWDYEPVEEIELDDALFDVPLNRHLLWEYMKMFRANQRQGTASTKNRANVRGSSRKLWKQKGTGRARMGTRKSPLWRKGGVAFGPHPRDFRLRMNKKAKRRALMMALSQRLRDDDLIILQDLTLSEPKTKQLKEKMDACSLSRGVLFVDRMEEERNLHLASRNLPAVDTVPTESLNPYHVLSHRKVVLSKTAVERVMEVLKS